MATKNTKKHEKRAAERKMKYVPVLCLSCNTSFSLIPVFAGRMPAVRTAAILAALSQSESEKNSGHYRSCFVLLLFALISVYSWLKTMSAKSPFFVPCDLLRLKTIPSKFPFCVFCAFLRRTFTLLVFCCSFSAVAELTWEQRVIRLEVHPLQVEGKAAFHFKNTGTNTVDILAVHTTCGCMKASAGTNQVAPGELGTIDVVFDYREKTGPQRKAVAVRFSDSKPIILYVEANIQNAFSLSVELLEWSLPGDREPKTCRLTNRFETPYKLISATSSSDQFIVKLIPIREGFEYEIVVIPKTTISKPTGATITIQTQCPPELPESRVYTFKAVVR